MLKREYLIEAAALGTFMVSACVFTALLEHPGSPVREVIASPLVRRFLNGMAMGLTAIAIIYSPWGKRSGAHMNPAVTLTFWILGKTSGRDALSYVTAQFAGGLAGVLLSAALLGAPIAHPAVNYVVTVPGAQGPAMAFVAEGLISFLMMLGVLTFANRAALNRYTGLLAGTLLVVYITLEAPLSGMSLNPARTLASAAPARLWTSLWIYFAAPTAGMLLAALAYRSRGLVLCAKLHHENDQPCIFRCAYMPRGVETKCLQTTTTT